MLQFLLFNWGQTGPAKAEFGFEPEEKFPPVCILGMGIFSMWGIFNVHRIGLDDNLEQSPIFLDEYSSLFCEPWIRTA
jgi:hypothetical protein